MTKKFRHQRGGFAESMDTTILVNDNEQLRVHLSLLYGKEIVELESNYASYDKRNGWETYIVSVRFIESDHFNAVGYSNFKL